MSSCVCILSIHFVYTPHVILYSDGNRVYIQYAPHGGIMKGYSTHSSFKLNFLILSRYIAAGSCQSLKFLNPIIIIFVLVRTIPSSTLCFAL